LLAVSVVGLITVNDPISPQTIPPLVIA